MAQLGLDSTVRRNPYPLAAGDARFSRTAADPIRLGVVCEKLARPTINAGIEAYFDLAEALTSANTATSIDSPSRNVFEGLVATLRYRDVKVREMSAKKKEELMANMSIS